jgi:hypothetical protein
VPGFAPVAYNAATGARLWVSRYNGPARRNDAAYSVAVGPHDGAVFATGISTDYATIAYNAATGAQLWARCYNGPGNGDDTAYSVAVGPGGRMVFVTGYSTGASSSGDDATVACKS